MIDYYVADVVSAQDFYPFGLEMPGRTYTAHSYRYSFNGKEDDNEAESGFQDYGMREYDKKRGQFISVDPLTKKYPFYTPYSFAGNKPIAFIDLDGLEEASSKNTIITGGWGAQLTVRKVSDQEAKEYQRGMGTAGLVGGAVITDVFITKGRLTTFLLMSEGLGTLYHNKAKSPEQARERGRETLNALKDLTTGYILLKPVSVIASIVTKGEAVTLSSSNIRTTQTTVNGVEDYITQFSKAGKYNDNPIDIVKMEDDIYSSADHARLMAAENLGYNVKANLHKFNDTITPDQAKRFVPEGTAEDKLPKTWGEAIKARVKGQGKTYSTQNPNGSFTRPQVKS